ncbi:MAG: murein biosynthesis integral membrane protein MurJ [Acidimicrobiia bacterium]|nr:murein biosynthesis integral membrane protein MurJ [Acidimicrobiia bacterium]
MADHSAPPDTPVAPTRRAATLLRSSLAVSAGTALSRITGLIRTLVLAGVLGAALVGATGVADAYNLANTAPNALYDLLIGGVLAATLVPVLVARTEEGDRRGVEAVVTVLLVTLAALTLLTVVFAPWIVRLFTFQTPPLEQAEVESVAVPLLRLFLPQVFFYGATALGTALLNAHRRFALAAFAPVLNNVVVVCVLLAVPRVAQGTPTLEQVRDDPVLLALLGLGTTAGIVAMALVLVPGLVRAGVPLGWNLAWRHPAVTQIVRLSGWTFGYVLANQIGLVLLLGMALGLGEGPLSAWTYAYLFFQLPFGLFAVAVMTTFLPELSSAFSRGDAPAYRDRFLMGGRLILVVILPCAAAMAVLARPLVAFLFEGAAGLLVAEQAFTAASGELTAEALALFAVGLPGFSLYLYVMRGFYARRNTRIPFFVNLAKTVLMVALAVPMTAAWSMAGLVGAFSVAYTVGGVMALVVLARTVDGLGVGSAVSAVARSLLAALATAAAAWAVAAQVSDRTDATSLGGSAASLALGGLAAGVAYLAVLVATRSPDLAQLVDRIRRRSGS